VQDLFIFGAGVCLLTYLAIFGNFFLQTNLVMESKKKGRHIKKMHYLHTLSKASAEKWTENTRDILEE